MQILNIKLRDNILNFIKKQASEERLDEARILERLVEKEYEKKLLELYNKYQKGEISLGYLSKEIGLGRWEVEEILESRKLKITNV